MEIGNTIRTLRTAAGFSQKDFANRLEMSSSYLSLLESGQREPSVSILRQVSRVLKVPISVLLYEGQVSLPGLTEDQQRQFVRVQELSLEILKDVLVRSVEGKFA